MSLEESAWTVTGCTLMLELVKRPAGGSEFPGPKAPRSPSLTPALIDSKWATSDR